LIDLSVQHGGRQWNPTNYANARVAYQYDLVRDTANLFFHTRVQEDIFYGHMLKKKVFKHQWIDFYYMANQPLMIGLVPKL